MGVAPGPQGGSAAERGSAHRAGVAAVALTYALVQSPLPLEEGGDLSTGYRIPAELRLEVDAAVDDLVIVDTKGRRAWIQAKADTNQSRAMRDTARQWVRAVQGRELNAEDVLVLAAPPGSALLANLRRGLNRMRDRLAGPLSVSEEQAVAKLRCHIQQALKDKNAEAVVAEIVRRAVIWEIDGTSDASPGPSAAISILAALLDSHRDSATVFRLLRGEVADRARLRSGVDVARALNVLGEARPLAAGKLSKFQLQMTAIGNYKKSVAARARYLPVQGLSARIPPVPVPDLLDYLWLRTPSDEFAYFYHILPLGVAIRRFNRILILGGPGAGKTTALVHIAASLGKDPCAPLPAFVRLQDLASGWRRGEPIVVNNNNIAAAVSAEELSKEEREALSLHIQDRLLHGRMLLLLDGLDELGSLRNDAAHALRAWLDGLPGRVRVIATSRDSTYASAQVLGLPSYALGSPHNLNDTVRKVLKLASNWDGRPDCNLPPDKWYGVRQAWMRHAVGKNWPLLDVPLYAMQIAVLAAGSKLEELPTSTASALHAVISSIWTRWESGQRRRGLPPLPGMQDTATSTEAMWSTFSVIAGALGEGGSRRDRLLEAAVAHLRQEFGLPRGQSIAAARQLLEMWDEAGLLVSTGKEEIVHPSTPIIIEVAKAIHASNLPQDEKSEWVRTNLADPANREILLFAAGLDKSIRSHLLHLGAQHGDLAAALFVHAPFNRDLNWRFEENELGSLDTLITAAVKGSPEAAVPAILTLAYMDLPESLQRLLIADAEPHIPVGWRNVAFAIAAERWPRWDHEAPRVQISEQLTLGIPDLPPQLSHEDDPDVAWRAQAFRRMLFQAVAPEKLNPLPAQAVLSWGLALHAAVTALSEHEPSVIALGQALARVIPDGGHTSTHMNMLAAEKAKVPYGSASIRTGDDSEFLHQRDARAMSAFLDFLAKLDSEAGEPEWSLEPLVRVFSSAGLDPTLPGFMATVLSPPYERTVPILRAISYLQASDFAVVCATARSALSLVRPLAGHEEKLTDHLWLTLLRDHVPSEPGGASYGSAAQPDNEIRETISTLINTFCALAQQCDVAALIALSGLENLPPVHQSKAVKVIKGRLLGQSEHIPDRAVVMLARLACQLDQDCVRELSDHPDPLVRIGLADAVTHYVVCGGQRDLRPLLGQLGADTDLAVRSTIVEHVSDDDGESLQELPDLVEAAVFAGREFAVSAWSCANCGHRGQPIYNKECINCGIARSHVAEG